MGNNRHAPITYYPYRFTAQDQQQLRTHSRLRTAAPVVESPCNPYIELLREQGLDPEETGEFERAPQTIAGGVHEPILPALPVSWSREGLPQFSTRQLSWAQPEDFGWLVYEVIERPAPFALSWAQEQQCPKRRPTHKYNRFERFRVVLGQLMLGAGEVPEYVLATVPKLERDGDMWEQLRVVLKGAGLRRYHNRIPGILCSLGYCNLGGDAGSARKYAAILQDFDTLTRVFSAKHSALNRVYFPSLRYICTRLMQRHAVRMPLQIPRARTSKKRAALDATFDLMWLLAHDVVPNEF